MGQRIKYEQLFEAGSIEIIEIDIINGAKYEIEFEDEISLEINDLENFISFVKERQISSRINRKPIR